MICPNCGAEITPEKKFNTYKIDYENEREFLMLVRGLKKYAMATYKDYYFTHRPKLIAGDFSNAVLNGDVYEINLLTDRLFEKVYGPCKLIFKVKNDVITFIGITPKEILLEGHNSELITYKGVLISKDNVKNDMFKINLLNMIEDKRK